MRPLTLARPTALLEAPRDVALLHADGALPNLALMILGTYFRRRGAAVRLIRSGDKRNTLFGDNPTCYGSSIFSFSAPIRAKMEREWGPVVWGGTGVRVESHLSEIDPTVDFEALPPDYSLYPEFPFSLGFSQRGCRFKCGFCVVPRKEGAPVSVNRIADIWRGEGHPKKVVLLDNDFFGQPREAWQARLTEIRAGGFKVCFSQGINIRMIDEESAAALASVEYRDNEFRERILYTAWDNLGDEERFFRGVDALERAGILAKHLRVYMLIGFSKRETFADIQHRFGRMVERGCQPYPMVFSNDARPAGLPEGRTLKHFQRWVLTGLYRAVPFSEYDPHIKAARSAKSGSRRDVEVRPKIIRNAARCKKCNTVVESRSVHSLRACKCKAMFVDGGLEYLRRGGDLDAIEELSQHGGET